MNINIQRSIKYKAKCYKNVEMELKNLSMSQYKQSMIYHPPEKDTDGEVIKVAQIEYDLDVMFRYMVSDIINLTITDENKKVIDIKTGIDILNNPGLNDLYNELTPVLIKMEARVDSKN